MRPLNHWGPRSVRKIRSGRSPAAEALRGWVGVWVCVYVYLLCMPLGLLLPLLSLLLRSGEGRARKPRIRTPRPRMPRRHASCSQGRCVCVTNLFSLQPLERSRTVACGPGSACPLLRGGGGSDGRGDGGAAAQPRSSRSRC